MTQRAASRCGDAKAAATAEKLAVASLEAGVRDMRSAYYALSTLAALGRTAPAKALDSALALLQKLKASKGRLRDTPKGAASLTATAHGYLAAAAAQKVGTISSQHMPAVEGLLSGIPQVRLPDTQYHSCCYTLFLPKEARCVCRRAASKGCRILPLVGLASSKQYTITRGHVAQLLYRPPPARARHPCNRQL